MYRILFVIDKLNIGGASDYLIFLAREFKVGSYAHIVCSTNIRPKNQIPDDVIVNELSAESIYTYFESNNFEIIHWYKSQSTGLFENFIKKNKNNIPRIILTICQVPLSPYHKLAPNEIRYSQKIVSIDHYSYNCYGKAGLSNNQKEMIYFGTQFPEKKKATNNNDNNILFGRGSSLNKCHPEIISWYNSINLTNKSFHIVGIGENAQWLYDEIEKYNLQNNIIVTPHLAYESWLETINTFDIFLYQLPLSAYSSIDGTMQAAMMYEIPIIYYGPESPKELIDHGKTGFIANNMKEFIEYAELLAKDNSLRLEMGSNAKKKLSKYFSWQQTVHNYSILYNDVKSSALKTYKIKPSYKIYWIVLTQYYKQRQLFSGLFTRDTKKRVKKLLSGRNYI